MPLVSLTSLVVDGSSFASLEASGLSSAFSSRSERFILLKLDFAVCPASAVSVAGVESAIVEYLESFEPYNAEQSCCDRSDSGQSSQ